VCRLQRSQNSEALEITGGKTQNCKLHHSKRFTNLVFFKTFLISNLQGANEAEKWTFFSNPNPNREGKSAPLNLLGRR
jgi:hypothetical protein